MFWQEKIQVLKQRFQQPDFRDPLREGNEIIEKILVRLLKTTWLNFHNSLNRETLLKGGRMVKRCTIAQMYSDELEALGSSTNFWLLLVGIPLATDFRVYDCKLEPLRELLYMTSLEPRREFYIVDKKYAWLLYFKVDKMNDEAVIYELKNEGN